MNYELFMDLSIGILAISLILAFIRLIKGPSSFDRVVAFDCCLFLILGIILLESILLNSTDYLDILLVVSLLGFVGTLATAAYLEGSLLD